MTDAVDLAQAAEEQMRSEAMAAHRQQRRPQLVSPAACCSCGGEIEPARREALPGTQICAWCARDLERRRK